MNEEVKINNKNAGMTAGLISCFLAILGILFLGTIFVPIAAIVTIFGSVIAIRSKSATGIGVNALAWVLTFVGLITSPVLLGLIGLASL